MSENIKVTLVSEGMAPHVLLDYTASGEFEVEITEIPEEEEEGE